MKARPARRRGKKRAARTRISTSSARSFVIVAVLRVGTVATFNRSRSPWTFLSLTQSHFSPLKTPRNTELQSFGLGLGGVPASVATREKGSCHYVPSSAAKTDGFAALWREGLVLARASLWSMWGAFKKSELRGLCENVRFFVAAVILSRWTHWVTHWLNTRERTQVAPSRGWSDWDLHINSRKETWNCWKVWRLSNTPSLHSSFHTQ